ncbi:MAG: helix-turn-helix domain-containing protein [Planctomycetaceae bacterium]|nr:helix-turn-helix domain-containing protein [Planctomycetaceae bacterium]MCA9047683.1 helix-turn-helix domain-containing protein [Planctomycetaceae bacterium]
MPGEQEKQERLLTVAEVAEWLSVSNSLVYQIVDSGKLPVYRIGNGRGAIRFRPDDIEDYLASCRSEKTVSQPSQKLRPRLKHIRLN